MNTINLLNILQKSSTNKTDLYKLLDELEVKNVKIDWGYNHDRNKYDYMILNIGNGLTGGSHWVAVSNKHKRYFDSFGMPPRSYIPKDYEWTPLQIQDIRFGRCGQYAALFLYYCSKNEIDKFYNLFHIE